VDGASFALAMGDEASATAYANTAALINATLLSSHWMQSSGGDAQDSGGGYVFESTNRLKDGAVIVGFNDGFTDADGLFSPTSLQVAVTVANYNIEFCHEWEINEQDTAAGIPGILYGRYPGDTYQGGNPWVLSSSALGNLFYRGAIEVKASNGTLPSSEAQEAWASVFGVDSFPKDNATQAADLFLRAGDGVMLRVRAHVEPQGFHLFEQIDRNTGAQESAADLTWSYAETLSAVASRQAFMALL